MEFKKSFKIWHAVFTLCVVTMGAVVLIAGCLDPETDTGSGGNNTAIEDPSPLLVDCEFVDIPDNGKIYRLPIEGGVAPTEVVANLNFPWGLVVDRDTDTLYFTEDGTGDCTGSIKTIPANAPTDTIPEIVASALDRPVRPLLHAGYLYYAQYKEENGSVNRIHLETGIKDVLLDGLVRPFGLVLESEGADVWVYLTEDGSVENSYTDGSVMRFSIDENGFIHDVMTLAENLRRPLGLAIDTDYVYVVEMDGGRVFRMIKAISSSSKPEQEVLMTGLLTPYPPVLDGGELYFAEFNIEDINAGKIFKISGVDANSSLITELSPTDCGSGGPFSCTLLAESLNWPMAVTLDESNVYWTEIYSPSIKAVGRNGSPADVIELASGIVYEFKTSPWIIIDGDYLFFADLGNVPCCFGRFGN